MTTVSGSGTAPGGLPVDETPEPAATAMPPEIVAQTIGEFIRAWAVRVRRGDSGVLPVVVGLLVTTILFEIVSPRHVYLSALNVVNLFQQSAVFMVLAMAEIFVLLLGEIDLSAGYIGACGGVIGVQLVEPVTTNWPWWGAIPAALLACAIFGALQGTLITRLRLPSFIVTLAGLLIGNGLMLILLAFGPFSGYPTLFGSSSNIAVLNNLMWGNIDPTISWFLMIGVVAILGAALWFRDARRRRNGLVSAPVGVSIAKIVLIAVVGVVVVWICDLNRANFGVVNGVPWVIPIVFVTLGIWMVLLQRTRFGRYIYAIGGNPEAARRAGINLASVRTWAFALCSLTAGIAGLLYASYLGGMSNNVNGGQLVLYAVAAGVIGGTSLFGGRGKVMHGVLGGLVIGSIYNGMYLLGFTAEWQFIITGIVLIAAVTVDSLSRRGATTGSVAHV